MIDITIHFLRPYFLCLLVPASYLWYRWYRFDGSGQAWSTMCDAHLLKHLLIQGKRNNRMLWLLGVAWLLAIIALSGPTWSRVVEVGYRQLPAYVFVLDLSPSMLEHDKNLSRLDRAKFYMQDSMRVLAPARFGCIVFTGQAFTVLPLTEDASTLYALLPSLQTDIMPLGGHNTAAALQQAARVLHQGRYQKGTILLLTNQKVSNAAIEMAHSLHRQGIRTTVIGLMFPNASRQQFAKLAKAGGGRYIAFHPNQHGLSDYLSSVVQHTVLQEKIQGASKHWQDKGYFLLWLLIPLVALMFRRETTS